MINHLEQFFSDEVYPLLITKFAAFVVWILSTGRIATLSHMAFLHSRDWMVKAAVLFAASPNASMSTKVPDLPSYRKVERLLKASSFTIANPIAPSLAPPGKCAKINCNVRPHEQLQQYARSQGRGRGYQNRGRGRGSYSSPCGRQRPSFPPFPIIPPSHISMTEFSDTGSGKTSSSSVRPTFFPIPGRILSFEDDP